MSLHWTHLPALSQEADRYLFARHNPHGSWNHSVDRMFATHFPEAHRVSCNYQTQDLFEHDPVLVMKVREAWEDEIDLERMRSLLEEVGNRGYLRVLFEMPQHTMDRHQFVLLMNEIAEAFPHTQWTVNDAPVVRWEGELDAPMFVFSRQYCVFDWYDGPLWWVDVDTEENPWMGRINGDSSNIYIRTTWDAVHAYERGERSMRWFWDGGFEAFTEHWCEVPTRFKRIEWSEYPEEEKPSVKCRVDPECTWFSPPYQQSEEEALD